MKEFPQVRAYWDTQNGVKPGWYAEVVDERDNVVNDSQKVAFPVEVDDFSRTDGAALAEALGEAFPEHEIYVEQQA